MHYLWTIFLISLFIFPSSLLATTYKGTVEHVIDGDTVVIDGTTVRLIGIDAPETNHPAKPAQCYGGESKEYALNMLGGRKVEYKTDKNYSIKDKYNRLLAYLYVDGKLYNAEAIKNGYALAYTRFPFKYLKKFVQLEAEAKENKLGMWKSCKIGSNSFNKPLLNNTSDNSKGELFAKSGCCSHHGGVCGCDESFDKIICCDGTLSPSCTCSKY